MTRYCPACGEDVETYVVKRVAKAEVCCVFCGMILEGLPMQRIAAGNTVIVADDSQMIREILKDVFIKGSLADEVIGCKDGYEFISTLIKKLKEEKAVSLAVLDVTMPVLDGINAAVAMRAVEKGLDRPPIPILFFTGQKCDENFQKVLESCKPAQYVNKGADSTPDLLASRVTQVVKVLLNVSR